MRRTSETRTYAEGESRPGWKRCPCGVSRPYQLKRSRMKPDGFGWIHPIKCSACGHVREVDCVGATKLETAPYDKRRR